MKLLREGARLFVLYRNESDRDVRTDISAFRDLGNDAKRFLFPALRFIGSLRPCSRLLYLRALNEIGMSFVSTGLTSLPATGSAWQIAVADCPRFFLTGDHTQSNINSRMRRLQLATTIFRTLRDQGAIPESVELPHVRIPLSFARTLSREATS